MQYVTTAEEIAGFVRSERHVRVIAGGTKTALNADATLSVAGLSGVLHYDPAEFTITALAGTTLLEVEQLLGSHGQYLPFDPPLVEAGATLGGTVAAGLSGSGRFRYGGVRDFLLGVRIVTEQGEIVTMGSKVVKNAAGFDFPKLMVGSLGRFGVMTELTFKVFPAPQRLATIVVKPKSKTEAVSLLLSLATSKLDLHCLDLDIHGTIWARIGGMSEAIEPRTQEVLKFIGQTGEILLAKEDAKTWRACREFCWIPPEHSLIKAAITPDKILALAAAVPGLAHRICVGGHLAWLTWPHAQASQKLDSILQKLDCAALAVTGKFSCPWLGEHKGSAFENRLLAALDPDRKFQLADSPTCNTISL